MKKWAFRISIIIVLLILFAFGFIYLHLKDKHSGFKVDISIPSGEPSTLSAGFSAVVITPTVSDTWVDNNKDFQFNEKDGDIYVDVNGNGKFDAVWMAGFQNMRPAQGVHDDLWARTMIIDDGKTRIALVAIDAIGFMADDIIDVRKSIPAEWGITYTIITSTHTHEGPDLIGLWGESDYTSGVNSGYLQFVKEKIRESIEKAVKNVRPAKVSFAQDMEGPKNLVADFRDPQAFDYGLRIMHVTDAKTGSTLGTLVAWASHPETLEDKNLLISSDFPNYVREAVEKGVYRGDSIIYKGKGGVCIYVNGAIGGMMSTPSEIVIADLFNQKKYVQPSFEKAAAQGQHLALLALKAIDSNATQLDQSSIQLRAKTFNLPMDNKLYRLGAAMGVFSRGLSGWWKIRTEISVWQLGPATFLHEPGELYPEIANGGVESPAGQDYLISPVETPSLRELMPGKYKFIIGLSNDMIGYIIPKSQWDEKAPFTYKNKEAPYGEINSVGPETGPIIYKELKSILKDASEKK